MKPGGIERKKHAPRNLPITRRLFVVNNAIKILENFTKQQFDLASILDSAEDLKYIKAIRKEFEKEILAPSDELVRLLVNRFFGKTLTANRLLAFKYYSRKALAPSINESISDRLKSALHINDKLDAPEETSAKSVDAQVDGSKVITTEEELEAFHIVKAILREKIPATRIAARDTQSYFGVLLDNNDRKPLCRFHFNGTKKYLEIFQNGKDAGRAGLARQP
ncbi:hypothetical protein C7T94_04205 [Pedobacter yulinensis]|uniref:Uncharacterized protein n=1 Tax=Pedobacter yulinensis TaxID=2126353 RepID=A0A2T3HNH9_9SPHI|nr:hypothetical protein [Pedobacter yulinensis]PST83953.1 hypothetical protein C7T94_04205 [Pedobacter yulinensis]